jgi:hypothetical protein
MFYRHAEARGAAGGQMCKAAHANPAARNQRCRRRIAGLQTDVLDE